MNYSAYYPTDILNGTGVRCVLFLSGCSHGCKGCYNTSAWNPKSGEPFTKEVEDQIINDLKDTRIKRAGLTLTGGDPLFKGNLQGVKSLIKRVREECPDKNIWMWTGYDFGELDAMRDNTQETNDRYHVAVSVDTLVDGKFDQNLYDPALKFRGSSNQNIINIVHLNG